jgi:hypothetical protein
MWQIGPGVRRLFSTKFRFLRCQLTTTFQDVSLQGNLHNCDYETACEIWLKLERWIQWSLIKPLLPPSRRKPHGFNEYVIELDILLSGFMGMYHKVSLLTLYPWQQYQTWLDKSTPYTPFRWLGTGTLLFLFFLRIFIAQGWYIGMSSLLMHAIYALIRMVSCVHVRHLPA